MDGWKMLTLSLLDPQQGAELQDPGKKGRNGPTPMNTLRAHSVLCCPIPICNTCIN